MSVIPNFVNEELEKEYAADGVLFQTYPELLPYREEILEAIEQDRKINEDMVRRGVLKSSSPLYVASGGAPLAGKTTVLEKIIKDDPTRLKSALYADPDQTGIPLMVNLNRILLSTLMKADKRGFRYVQKRAYDVARPASNIFTNNNINWAIENSVNLVHGTTMTSPFIRNLMTSIRDAGYRIELNLVGAEDETRMVGADYRAEMQANYQATSEDVRDKGLAFPQCMADYFTHGDKISIYWHDDVTTDAVLAAVYENGRMELVDEQAYESFVNKYDEDCMILARPEHCNLRLPEFETHEAIYTRRFQKAPSASADFSPEQP